MGQIQPLLRGDDASSCVEPIDDQPLGFNFLFAFQPIVNTNTGHIYAQEALVRGMKGEGAGFILSQINDSNRYYFDQKAREKALQSALFCEWQGAISLNFMPNALYHPEHCLSRTLDACKKLNINPNRIIFEWSEKEYLTDYAHIRNIISTYKHLNFKVAFDDFGGLYSNLNLLTAYHPDIIKLDRHYVIGIEKDRRRRAVVKAMVNLCRELNIDFIVEGVETLEEYNVLKDLGVDLMQGFLLARPALMQMPHATMPY
ncbi:MAG: EAL domain-containing protein [Zymomonas mobilis]|uniref:EAL domain-containing protein (Putative c-di-GMP-specific phosphodiesterase class I) n=1 Tax=Zymomonas mobilis TaxID=542 RepID=A0A542W2K5_ZYMMB|nr:EAL domain-containing protein [Zymomonas mobilis]TQL17815.1 EAL domain-containing protein (putative c-di-GMP-specific phosphodiesterase class I) [Zymomonas mobilis]